MNLGFRICLGFRTSDFEFFSFMGLSELAIIIFLAAVFGILAKLFRQPIILAYLACGIAIGALGLIKSSSAETFRFFSDLGIMFLLFLVGLEINYSSLKLVGLPSLVIGLGQIGLTFIFGFFISLLLGFDLLPAIYLGLAVTFSSTIISVKLLSDKRELASLHGKISIGLLLAQDVVAVMVLVLLAGASSGQGLNAIVLLMTVIKGIGLFILMLWLGRSVMPFVFDRIARSHELLFLASLAWVFLLAVLVSKIGFSIEIAGLLAGLALANSSERLEIAARIRPLRDFFMVIFFVFLGTSVAFSHLTGMVWAVVLFTLFVLVVKPLIVILLVSAFGYRKKTSILSGITIAQVSEFSLILVALAYKFGQLPESVVTLVTSVAVLTVIFSTYAFSNAAIILKYCSSFLRHFEAEQIGGERIGDRVFRKPIIIVGCHRTGESIVRNLPAKKLLIIDFDPDVINRMKSQKFETIFGDSSDPEIFEKANFKFAELVISTNPDSDDNITLIKQLKKLKKRPRIVARADTLAEAKALYREGADYVLLPHFTSGHYFGKFISGKTTALTLKKLKAQDVRLLGLSNKV